MRTLAKAAAVAFLTTAGVSRGAEPASPASAPGPDSGAPRILLVAFSGAEDAMRLAAPFRHAVILRDSGAASDVAVVVYGRAVTSVVASVKSVPPRAREDLQKALQAGVKVYVCENSLEMAGLASAPLLPGVVKVPLGAVQVARLVAQRYVPLQY